MSKVPRASIGGRKSINMGKPKEKTKETKDETKKKQNDDKNDEIFERNIEIVIALLSSVPYKSELDLF
jgi:hypothetical protein